MTKSPSRCQYCGRELETRTLDMRGHKLTVTVRCGCEGQRQADRAERYREVQGQLVRAWEGTGVPKRYRGVAEDRQRLESLGQGAYLSGPKGVGKTYAACAIMKAFVRREQREGYVSARFVSVPDWLASMRTGWGEPEAAAYGRAARCSLLVLDDLGKGKPSEWAMERLFRLIDERYNEMRATIVTSQYPLEELGGRLAAEGDAETAEAIVSRLTEMCRPLALGGPDRRLAGA